MSFADLMQKFGSYSAATVATAATISRNGAGTVAGVATVAVANSQSPKSTLAYANTNYLYRYKYSPEGENRVADESLPLGACDSDSCDSCDSKSAGTLGLGIPAWRRNVLAFDPKTTVGERLRSAALSFLGGGQAQIAEGLGWGAAELFSVFNGTADTIARRVDAKGIVPFLALAPWPGTRVQAFAATHAVFITGTGGRFLAPKRAAPGSILFWDARGL